MSNPVFLGKIRKVSSNCCLLYWPRVVNLTLVLLNPIYPAFANSVDPDQLASKKPTDLDLHCLPFSMQIYINNLDQVI